MLVCVRLSMFLPLCQFFLAVYTCGIRVSCRLKTEKVGPEAEMIRKGG